MDEALGAGKSERTAGRRGYRSGYYCWRTRGNISTNAKWLVFANGLD